MKMGWTLLLVLTFAWVMPVPALSQTSHGGSSGAQYDQYGFQDSGVGDQAAHAAIVASDAIRAASDEVQAAKASAEANAEEQNESANTVALTELPQTGGPSPLWLGVPLVCVGSLLVRRIFLS